MRPPGRSLVILRFRDAVHSKDMYRALGFTLLLTVFEELALEPNIFPYLRQKYYLGPHPFILIVGMLAVSLATVAIFVWAALRSRAWTRWIYFGVLAIASFVEYGYVKATGRFMRPYELAVLLGATVENYRDMVTSSFNMLGIVPASAFGVLLITQRSGQRSLGFFSGVTAGILAVFLAIYPVSVSGEGPATISAATFFRAVVLWPLQTEWPWVWRYKAPRATIAYTAESAPQNNVVLIIDESVRGDHLGINGYVRDTTPILNELEEDGFLYNWGIASSASTYSYASDAVLLTGVHELPDHQYRTRLQPTVFQYAKAMRYTTYYFSGQVSRYPEEPAASDMRYIDQFITTQELEKDLDIDLKIAGLLRDVLERLTGNFVVIQKRGIHFDYDKNYPRDAARWTPVLGSGIYEPRQRGRLINSYDNALHYNSEGFFRTLLGNRDVLRNTVIVYTSDHGQTLGEGGATNPHGDATRSEANVPLVILSKPGLQVETRYRASHFNVVPTLLAVMNFPPEERQYGYASSLIGPSPRGPERRYFLVGGLHGGGYGEISGQRRGILMPFDD